MKSVVFVAAAALLIAGCTALPHRAPTGAWVQFGPLEIPESAATQQGMVGSGEVRLPEGSIVTLNAAEILGKGPGLVRLPDRDNYTITGEQYSYTLDGNKVVLVGVVQAKHTMHFRGYTELEFVTFVLAISAEKEPRELARTRVLRGGEHTAVITGRSDQGVIAVQLEGVLNTNVPHDSRVVGVDAIRATEVWGKEHGYSSYGEGEADFYLAPSPDACATQVERYDVASGLAETIETFASTDDFAGETCLTAAADRSGS